MSNFHFFALFISYLSGGLFVEYHNPKSGDIPGFDSNMLKALVIANLVILPYILLYQNFSWWIAFIIHIVSILITLNIIIPGFIIRFHSPRNYGIITFMLNVIAFIVMFVSIF